jgi:hypothetical protein
MTTSTAHAAWFDGGRTVLLGGGRRVGTRITGTAGGGRRHDEFRYSEVDPRFGGDSTQFGDGTDLDRRLLDYGRTRNRDPRGALRLPIP